MGERYNIHSQLEHLQSKYIGTGHADTTKYDWAVNQHRDSLASYQGHTTPVNCIAWNPFFPEIFISCASESLVIVWHKELSTPILR